MLKCSICEKEFKDNELIAYAKHVSECAKQREIEEKIKEVEERAAKANDALNKVKKAEEEYNKLKDEFAKNYPDLYDINFPENDGVGFLCEDCDGCCTCGECEFCNCDPEEFDDEDKTEDSIKQDKKENVNKKEDAKFENMFTIPDEKADEVLDMLFDALFGTYKHFTRRF